MKKHFDLRVLCEYYQGMHPKSHQATHHFYWPLHWNEINWSLARAVFVRNTQVIFSHQPIRRSESSAKAPYFTIVRTKRHFLLLCAWRTPLHFFHTYEVQRGCNSQHQVNQSMTKDHSSLQRSQTDTLKRSWCRAHVEFARISGIYICLADIIMEHSTGIYHLVLPSIFA